MAKLFLLLVGRFQTWCALLVLRFVPVISV